MHGTSEELAELLAKLVVAVARTECKCDFDSKQSVLFHHLVQKRQILLFDIQRFHQMSQSHCLRCRQSCFNFNSVLAFVH